MPSIDSNNSPSLSHIATSSVGMAFVALICGLSGLMYGLGRAFEHTQVHYLQVLQVFLFAVLIYPYFYSRYVSVEGPKLNPDELRDRVRFVSFWITLCTCLFVILTSALLVILGIAPPNGWTMWFGLTGLAALPFLYLGITTHQRLLESGEIAEGERLFKNKVLIPAFATCLISFSFGWAINHTDFWWTLIVPILLIVTGRHVVDGGWRRMLPFVLGVILVAFVSSLLFHGTMFAIGRVVLTGIIMTLGMGVSEVCKRVVSIANGDQFVATPAEDATFYLSGSNWSSIVFPLCLCLLPLLNVELAVLPTFAILSFQYMHWHYFSPNKGHVWLLVINVMLGFSLPLALGLQYYFGIVPQPPQINLFAELLGFFGFLVPLLAFFEHRRFGIQYKKFFSELAERQTYLSYDNCFALFLTVFFGAVLVVGVLALLVDADFAVDLRPKATQTVIYLIALGFFATLTFIFRRPTMTGTRPPPHRVSDMRHRESGTSSTPPEALSSMARVAGLLRISRTPVALIAGLPTFILTLDQHSSWLLACLNAIPMVVMTMAGFVLNDIHDVDKDKDVGPRKPLPTGAIPLLWARNFAWLLIVLSVLLGILLSQGGSAYAVAFGIVGVAMYSSLAIRFPLFKGLTTSLLSCIPFAYASLLCDHHISLLLYLSLMAFIFGREMLLDLRDWSFDAAVGIKTLAMVLGRTSSRVAGWCMMVGSLVVGLPFAHGAAGTFVQIALVSLSVSLIAYIFDEKAGLGLSRLTLLAGSIGIVYFTG